MITNQLSVLGVDYIHPKLAQAYVDALDDRQIIRYQATKDLSNAISNAIKHERATARLEYALRRSA